YRPVGSYDHEVRPDLCPEGVDLVSPPQAQGGAPGQEERDVGPQPSGQRLEAGRPQTDAPETVQGQEDGRRVPAAAPRPTADRDALGDLDPGPSRDAGVTAQLEGGPQGEVALVARDEGMIALHVQGAWPEMDDDVVVQVDRLEDRAQLVVAVLTQAEDLEAEVDLGEGPHAEDAGRRSALHRHPLHRPRASSALTTRNPGWGGSSNAASESVAG